MAEQQLAAAVKEQSELTGKRLLRKYLAERASSDDYEHYMGVVALAHRDLVDLEQYLRIAIQDNDGNEGLDRIVLYIDDLDRCDPHVVADVLDAVHLLLALPLFVVIVGVDPRWLKRSLRERHPESLQSTPSGVPSASPADYLEKIFQLTYSLPRMRPDSCADLLVAAAQETQALPTGQANGPTTAASSSAESRSPINMDPNTTGVPSEGSRSRPRTSATDLAQALTLHEKDIEALRDVAVLVSTSPRRAKRFLNIYLVIRARALGDPQLRERLNGNGDLPNSVTDNSLLALAALLLGLPKTMAASIRNYQSRDTDGTITLSPWLTEAVQDASDEEARLELFLKSGSSITKAACEHSYAMAPTSSSLPAAQP